MKNDDLPMRVAVYARKSVKGDESTVSIEDQLKRCKDLVLSKWPNAIITEFSDLGKSGKDMERPSLQEMISGLEIGRFDIVCIFKIDRLSRSIKDFYDFYSEYIENSDVKLISVNDDFDMTTPMGKIMLSLIVSFAELERTNISTRVKSAMDFAAENDGRWLGGSKPFGFDKIVLPDKTKTLVKNDFESKIVKDVFKYFAYTNGVSLYDITQYVYENYGISKNASGLKTWLDQEKYVVADEKLYDYFAGLGCQMLNPKEDWDGSKSCAIYNKKARGKQIVKLPPSDWKVYVANWKGFISSELYLTVQKRLKENAKKGRSVGGFSKVHYWQELSGFVKCSKCGSAVKIQSHKNQNDKMYLSLSCSKKNKIKGHEICDQRYWKITREQVWENTAEKIQKYLDNIQFREITHNANMESFDKKINKLEEEINNLLMVLEKTGTKNANSVMERIASKEKDIKTIRRQKAENSILEEDLVAMRVLGFKKKRGIEKIDYRSLSMEQKKSLLQILVKTIYVESDGSVILNMVAPNKSYNLSQETQSARELKKIFDGLSDEQKTEFMNNPKEFMERLTLAELNESDE